MLLFCIIAMVHQNSPTVEIYWEQIEWITLSGTIRNHMYHLGGFVRNQQCLLEWPLQNRTCILGWPIRNRPCILKGTIQTSCIAKCKERISTNLSVDINHLQTSSGKNFCQDAFGEGLYDASIQNCNTKTWRH